MDENMCGGRARKINVGTDVECEFWETLNCVFSWKFPTQTMKTSSLALETFPSSSITLQLISINTTPRKF
jgi:hypothetical protein